MGCPGLHCPGCGGGKGILAVFLFLFLLIVVVAGKLAGHGRGIVHEIDETLRLAAIAGFSLLGILVFAAVVIGVVAYRRHPVPARAYQPASMRASAEPPAAPAGRAGVSVTAEERRPIVNIYVAGEHDLRNVMEYVNGYAPQDKLPVQWRELPQGERD